MKKALKHLYKKDTIFKKIVDQFGVPQIPSRPQGFATLVLLILEQQVSINSAKATFIKLKNAVAEMTPQFLLNWPDENFKAAGVSRQKTSYVKELSAAVLTEKLNIESLANKTAAEVRCELIQIKGIGNWTIDVYLMFCLNAEDIIPLGDIAIVNTIKELLHITDRSAMENRAALWSPHRSLATFLLWHYYLRKRNRTVEY
ncbi:MAG: DNA-3-methyladenine glycosylase family protein [Ferruginibacter sp.]